MNSITDIDHQRAFKEAWAEPRHHPLGAAPADINPAVGHRYTADPPLTFTHEMLWKRSANSPGRPRPQSPLKAEGVVSSATCASRSEAARTICEPASGGHATVPANVWPAELRSTEVR
jgi:hypothetical protein